MKKAVWPKGHAAFFVMGNFIPEVEKNSQPEDLRVWLLSDDL